MPFIANTPESLIGRNDSKNPNSTCRGITASGRPCRRPVAASSGSQTLLPYSRRPKTPDPRNENLYCWQHKEQASMSAHSSPGPRATATPILEEGRRTSLDTLTDRLGLVDLQEKENRRKQKKASQRPSYGPGPSSFQPNGGGGYSKPAKKKEKPSLEFCFCFKIPLEEKPPPPRPQPQPVQKVSAPIPSAGRKPKQYLNASGLSAASPAKSSRKSNVSEIATLKNLIPNDVDTLTACALLSELAKPYTDTEEPGYIYMFWLTPEAATASRSMGAPPVDAARNLLAPPSPSSRSRRASDVVLPYADNARGGSKSKKTMVLKIGRAANVQRRMHQWQRQCGRDVEVLRYYPYSPSSDTLSPPRTAPHVKRTERLIHIELAGRGLKADSGACDACGREHREWFEVEASRKGVREVDDVIRRWVDWDEACR